MNEYTCFKNVAQSNASVFVLFIGQGPINMIKKRKNFGRHQEDFGIIEIDAVFLGIQSLEVLN